MHVCFKWGMEKGYLPPKTPNPAFAGLNEVRNSFGTIPVYMETASEND